MHLHTHHPPPLHLPRTCRQCNVVALPQSFSHFVFLFNYTIYNEINNLFLKVSPSQINLISVTLKVPNLQVGNYHRKLLGQTRGEPLMTCSDCFPILLSKLSQRSNLTSVFEIRDLNYPHIHVHDTLLIHILESPRPRRPPNSLRGQI